MLSFRSVVLIGGLISVVSCKKYLAVKPNLNLEIPSTSQDLQALMDNTAYMNLNGSGLGQDCTDDFYESSSDLLTRALIDQELYIWDPTAIDDGWNNEYKIVYYANDALDNISNVSGTEQELNTIKGEALFFRAYAFYNLAQAYSPAYGNDTKNLNLGICLRLSSNVSEQSVRSTVQETYAQIIGDLTLASKLLPQATEYPTTPSRRAAFGALARAYLTIQDYGNAYVYADSCLDLNGNLIDYNALDTSSSAPFSLFNEEDIFHSEYGSGTTLSNLRAKIDTELIAAYLPGDLRLKVMYKANADGSHGFKGDYSGASGFYPRYDGIATDEIYLIKAECQARNGEVSGAMTTLNLLLIKRFGNNQFQASVASTVDDAVSQILLERRKELMMRNIRWSDIKRLNLDPIYAITLKRDLSGTLYTLPPGDPRFSFLIPLSVISLGHINQNPR